MTPSNDYRGYEFVKYTTDRPTVRRTKKSITQLTYQPTNQPTNRSPSN